MPDFATHGKERAIASVAVNNSMIENWNMRGAWDDSFRLDFGEGWVFPWGSNHLSSVEVLSCGEVWPRWDDNNKIAEVDIPLAIVPGLTQFSCSRTQDNSYILSWINAALNRCTNALASAVIELRRSGNRVITFDGVTSTIVRELPFEHYGWGQDNEWVEHFFPDEVAEIEIAGGYTNWVDAIALEPGNGYYKLAVNIGEDPPEIVNLTVGEYSVAVTNAGEYVFLLQKGELYPIDFSFLPDGVSYSYDDGGPSEPPEPDWSELSFRSKSASQEVYYYTFRTIDDDGEGPELILPKRDGSGSMRWYPSLTIDPKSGVLFEYYSFFIATVYDLPFGEYPAFTWESGGKVIGRGDSLYFEDIESYSNEISVTATYRGVVLHGKIIVERHVRETSISIEGGGLILVSGPHLNESGEMVQSSRTDASL
ncbi:MAG: hypothetical protein J6R63_02995, partial [Kiritimatiellae bacterium]|nr:hypothetical protein [Kiritimatiellia bacterium]